MMMVDSSRMRQATGQSKLASGIGYLPHSHYTHFFTRRSRKTAPEHMAEMTPM